jgi:hypothetical protein
MQPESGDQHDQDNDGNEREDEQPGVWCHPVGDIVGRDETAP